MDISNLQTKCFQSTEPMPLSEKKIVNSDNIEIKDQDIASEVQKIIEQLELIDRSYFGKDRQKQIKQKINQAMSMLDQKPIDLVAQKKEKANLLYLRGKCLDYLPEYTKQAEENLSKSIKLLPSSADAWDALGHVYWKKRDIQQAKKCFEGSLEQHKDNKAALRNLSMVYRMQEFNSQGEKLDAEENKKNYQMSIELASKSVKLDMNDSQSWYVLGNAHLTNFFVNNESTKELESALKAYQMAEKNMKEPNPDLFFNRATVLEYLERYSEAVQNFQAANSIDPSLQGDQRANAIVGFVSRAYNSIVNKGRIKTNRLTEMVKSIPQNIDGQNTCKIVDISQLQNGENQGLMISSKVVYNLEKPSDIPVCFLLVDFKHNFCVMSVYHVTKQLSDKIRSGSEVLIKEPHLVLTKLQFKGYTYNYQCIKVTDIRNLLVNGVSLQEDYATSQVLSNTFA